MCVCVIIRCLCVCIRCLCVCVFMCSHSLYVFVWSFDVCVCVVGVGVCVFGVGVFVYSVLVCVCIRCWCVCVRNFFFVRVCIQVCSLDVCMCLLRCLCVYIPSKETYLLRNTRNLACFAFKWLCAWKICVFSGNIGLFWWNIVCFCGTSEIWPALHFSAIIRYLCVYECLFVFVCVCVYECLFVFVCACYFDVSLWPGPDDKGSELVTLCKGSDLCI